MQRAGLNLRGLIRTMLFKRFESSVDAFRRTLERMIATQTMFLRALEEGFVPAGEDATELLRWSADEDEDELLAKLSAVSNRYKLGDFRGDLLKAHIEADLALLREMLHLVEPITPARDAKLQAFLGAIQREPVQGRKCLIFTQYADTARYLGQALQADSTADVEVIHGSDKNKGRVVARFAPRANPQLCRAGDTEIRLLVATDVLAEGLNMQDCDIVLNYDLHWNPVRLIQRFGRIDRIGSEHEVIWGLNFLPETELEKSLGIQAVLKERIQEIHDTIGEDAAILDSSERLNEEVMYDIYGARGAQGTLFDPEDEGDLVDLNEAEELLRGLQRDDPDEFRRITELRDGIRSGKASSAGRLVALCRAGDYQQLMLVNGEGKVLSRDVPTILGILKSERDEPAPARLPADHNARVTRVRELFAEEVRHRRAQRDGTLSLSDAQKYVQRELRLLFSATSDDDLKPQINILERAFCSRSVSTAVKRELNALKRAGVHGMPLVRNLTDVYYAHNLAARESGDRERSAKDELPRIVCSEALF